jgi:hypothetical protein
MDRLLVRAWNFALIWWTDLTARICQLAAEFYCSVEFSKFGRFAAAPYLHCPEPRRAFSRPEIRRRQEILKFKGR